MIQCPNCRNQNPDDVRFCGQCGFPVQGSAMPQSAKPSGGPFDRIASILGVGPDAAAAIVTLGALTAVFLFFWVTLRPHGPSVAQQAPPPLSAKQESKPESKKVSKQASKHSAVGSAPVRPTFDCNQARTPSELQICSDSHLATLERAMVEAYNEGLNRTPQDRKDQFLRQHMEWFKEYARSCNGTADADERGTCIAQYLDTRRNELDHLER